MTPRTRHARVWMLACAALVQTGCSADRSDAPVTPATVDVTPVNDQQAIAGQALPDPIALVVRDRRGAPIAGVDVDWAPQDSGVVEPAHSVTGPDGIAAASWRLGPVPGDHTVLATVAGYGPVTIHAFAGPALLEFNAVHLLQLATPDGSGQTVHPDFVNVTAAGPLQAEFLAITAYPFGNAQWENPSLYTTLDRWHWSAPPAAANPVIRPQYGFLSDPDIVFNPLTEELWLYYRQVDVLNEIKLIRSTNGVTWSEPELVANALNHLIVSPSVVRRSETEWLMWSVNGQGGCETHETWVELRRSSDGRVWSAPERVSLTQATGQTPWHIDVQWIPSRNEYWAVYNVKTPESCSTPALFLATSTDGVTWTTYPSPILARGQIPELSDIVYRSTFRYRPETDAVTFWYSGAQYDGTRYTWRSAVQRRQRTDLFASITRPPTSALVAQLGRRVPPLLDPP